MNIRQIACTAIGLGAATFLTVFAPGAGADAPGPMHCQEGFCDDTPTINLLPTGSSEAPVFSDADPAVPVAALPQYSHDRASASAMTPAP